jgi:Gas vesicle synthesis protein GvpO/Gas vesicle protein G
MFLLDDVLLAPGKAAFVLFQELARKAQDEWLNDDIVKQELQQLYEMLEGGRISERDFEEKECRLLERLEQIARIKFQDKWGPETAVIDAVAEPAAPPPADLPALPPASPQADCSWPAVALSPPPESAASPPADLSWPAVALSPPPEPAVPVTPVFVAQPPAVEALAPPPEPPPVFAPPPPQSQVLMPPQTPPPMPHPPVWQPPVAPPVWSSPMGPPPMPSSAWPMPPPPSPPMPPPAWSPPPMPMPAPATAMAMGQIVDCAVRALSMLKMRMSSVTSVVPEESGWRVSIELVERRGIPDTSDLLGLYEVRVDAAGNVLRYERTQMRRRGDFPR